MIGSAISNPTDRILSGGGSIVVGADGAATISGGQVRTGRSKFPTITGIGGSAYSTTGNDTTPVAGTVYFAEVEVSRNCTLVGASVFNGSVSAGVDKGIVSLYTSAGVLVASSALAGVALTGTNAFQELPFITPYPAIGPARYWIGVQINGTTNRFRTITNLRHIDSLTTSAAGVFGTLANLTPPTTFTADVGPISYVYV